MGMPKMHNFLSVIWTLTASLLFFFLIGFMALWGFLSHFTAKNNKFENKRTKWQFGIIISKISDASQHSSCKHCWCMVAYTSNPSTHEAEARGLLENSRPAIKSVQGQPELHSETLSQRDKKIIIIVRTLLLVVQIKNPW